MPKELTHFTIAARILAQLKDSSLKSIIERNRDMFFIGAVALDTPYYLSGSRRSHFQALANRLHGMQGENTYQPLLNVINHYNQGIPDQTRALLCGVTTHIMIDSCFHPLVNHLNGDYHHPDPAARNQAVGGHRSWEGRLDLYYTKNLKTIEPAFLSKCLERAEKPLLLAALGLLYFNDPEGERKAVETALQAHARWLKWFANRSLLRAYQLGNIMTRGHLSPFLALFYPPFDTARVDDFEGVFEYSDPGTADKRRETIAQIEDRAITRTLEFYCKWSENLPDEYRWMAEVMGPSLETGQPGINIL